MTVCVFAYKTFIESEGHFNKTKSPLGDEEI